MGEFPSEAALVRDLGPFSAAGQRKEKRCIKYYISLLGIFSRRALNPFPISAAVQRAGVHSHGGLAGPRVTERRGASVVIHEVAHAFSGISDLPAFRKRVLVLQPEHERTRRLENPKKTQRVAKADRGT